MGTAKAQYGHSAVFALRAFANLWSGVPLMANRRTSWPNPCAHPWLQPWMAHPGRRGNGKPTASSGDARSHLRISAPGMLNLTNWLRIRDRPSTNGQRMHEYDRRPFVYSRSHSWTAHLANAHQRLYPWTKAMGIALRAAKAFDVLVGGVSDKAHHVFSLGREAARAGSVEDLLELPEQTDPRLAGPEASLIVPAHVERESRWIFKQRQQSILDAGGNRVVAFVQEG